MTKAAEIVQWVTLGSVLVVAVLLLFASNQIAGLGGTLSAIPRQKQEQKIMDVLETIVTNAAGQKVTVRCTRDITSGETQAELVTRFNALVALVGGD